LAEASDVLGVDVGGVVGGTNSTRVSRGTGVNVEMLDVGVSSVGVIPDTGMPGVSVAGILQDDRTMRAAMTAIQK
jgi:hypothetical protein